MVIHQNGLLHPLHKVSRSEFDTARQQGAFKSLAFARIEPNGANVYIATFTRGKLIWVIMPLSKEGKVTGVFFRPFPP